jgi:cytochrome c-type biogenesis protein CcmH
LLWALRKQPELPSGAAVAPARAVYRDQLGEIDRDLDRGLIGAVEAEAARNEISRRLLSTDREKSGAAPPAAPLVGGAAKIFIIVGIPLFALSIYLLQGRPDLPAVPHAERMAKAIENADLPALVARVEEHLATKPDDVEGWMVVAPAYSRLERYDDAAGAYAQIIRIKGASPALLVDYGEALVLANQGLVTAEARKQFDQALKGDALNSKARFYSALAMRQEGKLDDAVATWRDMLAKAPANAPWRTIVERQIAAVESDRAAAPVLDDNAIAGAKDMPAGDQQAMIRSMVDRLDARLAADGDDLDGWLRLARARTVLGEKDAAKAALGKAETRFHGNPEALERIASLRKALQLD